MLETYSSATLSNCSFIENKASDDGGAMYVRRRSQIIISNSNFQFNKAWNSGGSILVQHSLVIIKFSTFENDASVMAHGGSIAVEHVGNVTIDNCQFINCTAEYGGSVSVRAESIVIAKYSFFDRSFSTLSGGALYINQRSFILGSNVRIHNSKSTSGAGLFVSDSSDVLLREVNFEVNNVTKSGGTIYCKKSEISVEKGGIKFNYANLFGGGVFSEQCEVTFDYVIFRNNIAEISGGAINSESSTIDIHNCVAQENFAREKGEFALISSESKLKTNFLTLTDINSNLISITDSSEANMKHVHLPDGISYCPITATMKSHISLVTNYFRDGKTIMNSQERRKVICVDHNSSVEGTPTGVFLILFTNS